MKLYFYPFTLHFRYPFRIAHGERNTTPVVFVEIEERGKIGYGEAALPPYLPENTETVCSFLTKTRKFLSQKNISLDSGIQDITDLVNRLGGENHAAKAAVDIALHDLFGKINGFSLKKFFATEKLNQVNSTYTLGICGADEMKKKISEAKNFNFFKIKLNGENDKLIIESFISAIGESSFPEHKYSFCVDANQAWKDKHYAMDMIHWLNEKGALLVEQPLPKNNLDESAFLTENSPIPIIADEAVQGMDDIKKIKGAYSGINIKLMKCGGLTEARKMILLAKELKMKILIGCMSESSCAVTAAAHLAPFADWADLDGPYLVKNDPFEGIKIIDGKVVVPSHDGIGIKKIGNYNEPLSSTLS